MRTVITVRQPETNRRRVQHFTEDVTRTEQGHRNKVNINKIVAKYIKTGYVEQQNRPAMYGDFSGVLDYHSTLNRIKNAENEFQKIPSEIRKKFDNDIGMLVEYVNNPDNESECVRMGLLPRTSTVVQDDAVEPVVETTEVHE